MYHVQQHLDDYFHGSSTITRLTKLPVFSKCGAAWREFAWGALASGFGETLMHPVDTLKTRIQSGQSGVTLQVRLAISLRIMPISLFIEVQL